MDEEKHVVHKTLDQARAEIVRELNREKVLDRMDVLKGDILDSPQSEPFTKTAERLGIMTGTAEVDTDMPRIEGLGFLPELRDALKDKDLDPGVRINRSFRCGEDGRDQCIVRLLSRQPAHAPALAEAPTKVLADLKAQKTRELAGTLLRSLKEDAAADGKGLEKAVAAVAARNPGLTTGVSAPFLTPDLGPLPKPLDRQAAAARAAFDSSPGADRTRALGGRHGRRRVRAPERLPPDAAGFRSARRPLQEDPGRPGLPVLDGWMGSVRAKTRVSSRLAEAAPLQPGG